MNDIECAEKIATTTPFGAYEIFILHENLLAFERMGIGRSMSWENMRTVIDHASILGLDWFAVESMIYCFTTIKE